MASAATAGRFLALAACLVFASGALKTDVAQAGCGGVERVAPKKHLVDNRAPLIVGDSVLLGAMGTVAAEGFEVNAHGCRGWGEGIAYLRARRHAGSLPHLVVLQLGTNWSITAHGIREAVSITGSRRVLAIMTPREVGGFGGRDAQNVRAAAKRYPEQVLVLDWVRYTRTKAAWFAPDGIHLTWSGIDGIARFLRRAVPYAVAGSTALDPDAGSPDA